MATNNNNPQAVPELLSDDMLLAYIEGSLDSSAREMVEAYLQKNPAYAEAADGIAQLPPNQTKHMVHSLHKKLNIELKHKKQGRRQNNSFWNSVIIILILLLCLTAYLLIYMVLKNKM